jgi:hypothetical protein
MKRFLLFSFLIAVTNLSAQETGPPESDFIRDSLAIAKVKLVRPQFRFDNRVTFSEKQALKISGLDIGVLLSEKLRFTVGYYSMKDRLKAYDVTEGEEEFGRLIQLNYGSINTEINYKDKRFYSLGMPLEVCAGLNKFQDKNMTTGEILSTKTGGLVFVNFGMSATFKPMRFLGLKAMVGYRKVVYNQVRDYNFDGFFTAIGLNVDIHAVVADVRMYRLMKRYHRGNNLANAVEIITD